MQWLLEQPILAGLMARQKSQHGELERADAGPTYE